VVDWNEEALVWAGADMGVYMAVVGGIGANVGWHDC
jgi:hypothetical protein